jgi:hypothetical protein
MNRTKWLMVLSVLALSGCGELFGRSLNQPSGVVTNQLYRMSPGADLMRLPEQFPGARMRVESKDGNVVWTYSLRGKDACRFTAHVSPSGDSVTTVWTEVETLENENAKYLCITAKIAGDESVTATLDGREADTKKVQGELAAALVGNMDSVFKGIGDHMTQFKDAQDDLCREASTTAGMQSCRDGTWARDRDRR